MWHRAEDIAQNNKFDVDEFIEFIKMWWTTDVYQINLCPNGNFDIHTWDVDSLVMRFKRDILKENPQ